MIFLGITFTLVFGVIITLAYTRQRQYKYNPKQDYHYPFKKAHRIDLTKPIDLSLYSEETTLIFSLSLRATLFGYFFQPYVEVIGEKKERVYFEHGMKGIRYIDVSRFAGLKDVRLVFSHCTLISSEAELYPFDNLEIKNKRILVLASHADDAEIAAYGLYSAAADSYVITITVGEEGKCDYCDLISSKENRARLKGKLRVHDALSVPQLGNIPREHCAILGYYGKSLKWMHDNPDVQATSITGVDDFTYFRRVDHAAFECNNNPSSTWHSLVDDLMYMINSIQPEIIVTPHPQIDAHTDHQYTTYALLKAMANLKNTTIPMLTYTNHHIYNEAYPYGPIFSTSALAPKFEEAFLCKEVYSHKLSTQQQYEKFYALEAMHDLRDATLVLGVKKAWRHLMKQIKRTLQQRDKSYYRRSVRPNELFYVTDWEALSKFSK